MIKCGVYKIEDVRTGNVYVGSANDIKKRWSHSLAYLRGNNHRYQELQDAWNESEHNVKWEILEECPEVELEEREAYYMDYIDMIDGWTLINKTRRTNRHKVGDTSLMSKAQSGAKNGHATLTEQQIKFILWLKANGYRIKYIADKYGVSMTHISNIGVTKWKNVTEMCKPDWIENV